MISQEMDQLEISRSIPKSKKRRLVQDDSDELDVEEKMDVVEDKGEITGYFQKSSAE
jgi:hypothetical protein